MAMRIQRTAEEKNRIATLASSLIVAVISGLIVWWLTKPIDFSSSVVFDLEETGSFSTSPEGKYFYRLNIENRGLATGLGLKVVLNPGQGSKTSDVAILTSATKPAVSAQKAADGRLNIIIPSLKPGENISTSISIVGGAKPSPSVLAAMDNGKIKQLEKASFRDLFKEPLFAFFGLTIFAIGSQILFRIVRRRIWKIYENSYIFNDANNIAFVLLHAGQIKEAREILYRAISGGDPGIIALSNYAVALAQSGDIASASRIIQGAKTWMIGEGHPQSVVLFNEAIIELMEGKIKKEELVERFSANSELSKYLDRSALINGFS